MLIIPFVDKI